MKEKLVDITPARYSCVLAMSCPAVFKTENASYVIIGKMRDRNDPALQSRIGPDEMAIEISADLLEGALSHKTQQ